ncbi:MAG TPA: hypothetical protein PKC03_15270 [Dokdonella sp.]|jgi:hypothetical protein|nr:hypothetical protein [Dokdonella sp.]
MDEKDSPDNVGEVPLIPTLPLVRLAFAHAELVERVNLLEARLAELEGGPRAKH